METLKRRIDFIYMFDVQDGNPNGDPDAGNLPRVDFETDKGLVTDVCIKRKIRNYVDVVKSGIEGYDIFIREGAVLNTVVDKIYETPAVKNADKNQKKVSVKNALCEKYYDIRTFGAVIASKEKQGQVRGPVQLTFARSVDSVSLPLYASPITQHIQAVMPILTISPNMDKKITFAISFLSSNNLNKSLSNI